MPKRHTRPFRFNHMGSSLNWGTKRGLRRLPLVTDRTTGQPYRDPDGRFSVIWPPRRRGQRNSGLCKGCDRRTRVRYDLKSLAWTCRRCGAGGPAVITQVRGADDPGRMANPTRLANYLGQQASPARHAASKRAAIDRLTPAQRRRLVHKARGTAEGYRGPDRPLSRKARTETMRSHP